MDLGTIQAYAYLIGSILVVALLYGYIVYLYRSEKRGEKDFEKYSKLALDDNIDSKLLVPRDPKPKNNKKEK